MADTPENDIAAFLQVAERYLKRPLQSYEQELLERYRWALAASGRPSLNAIQVMEMIMQGVDPHAWRKANEANLAPLLASKEVPRPLQATNLDAQLSARTAAVQPLTSIDDLVGRPGAEGTEKVAQAGAPDDLKSLLALLKSFQS